MANDIKPPAKSLYFVTTMYNKTPIVIDNYKNAIDLLIKEFVRMYYTYDEDDASDRYIIGIE